MERHEGLAGARAVQVQRLSDQLLAGAGLAQQQDRRVRVGDLSDQLEQLEHLRMRRDDAGKAVPGEEVALQALRALAEPLLFHGLLEEEAGHFGELGDEGARGLREAFSGARPFQVQDAPDGVAGAQGHGQHGAGAEGMDAVEAGEARVLGQVRRVDRLAGLQHAAHQAAREAALFRRGPLAVVAHVELLLVGAAFLDDEEAAPGLGGLQQPPEQGLGGRGAAGLGQQELRQLEPGSVKVHHGASAWSSSQGTPK